MLGDEVTTTLFDLDAVDKSQLAVLVIDILGDPETSPLAPTMKPVVDNAARICAAARVAKVPVIFANDAHLAGLDRELELWGPHALAGTEEAQPSPQLGLSEGDNVVNKRRYSAFFQTGLRLLLDELGAKTLLCLGMDTNICVCHTLADAFYNNYNLVVAGDATMTFLVGNQEEGLAYLETCYGARIVSTDEAVELLER